MEQYRQRVFSRLSLEWFVQGHYSPEEVGTLVTQAEESDFVSKATRLCKEEEIGIQLV